MKKTILMLKASMLLSGLALADDYEFTNIGYANNVANSDGYGRVTYHYRIGKTEVTIAQFQASGITDSNANYWNDGTRNVGVDAPVVNITWHQAAQYCNWLTTGDTDSGAYTMSGGLVTAVMSRSEILADGRLFYVMPTEDEWYKAAYFNGNGYSLYANGTDTAPTHGVNANFNAPGGYANGPAWVVGNGSAETNGTFNMMGNIWEWLESADDGALDNIGEAMAFRGGDYFQGADKLESPTRGSAELPTGEFLNTGLRIVAIPEPGTISLMSLSTIGLFVTRTLRRRRRAGKSLLPIRREHLCDTFITYEEWESYLSQLNEVDGLSVACRMIKARALEDWSKVQACYKVLDTIFWNRMVILHERRKRRRKAFKRAVKTKTRDGLDAFLSIIMK